MATVEIIKGNLKTEKKELTSKKKRVCAYARVSTDSEEQLTSYESQIRYYTQVIKSNNDWEFVGIYADEGISGTQVKHRIEFQRMIRDALNGKIDIILTKSISRFARNSLDLIKYVRELKENNVEVRFEKENINTLDKNKEMFLTFYSAFAQAESESISENIQIGIKSKMKNGDYVGQARCYGYNWNKEKKILEINEKEAEVVRMIFNWYSDGIGSYRIAQKLNELNIPNYFGRKWLYGAIKKIITNEKYVGDLVSGKAYTLDPITHKRNLNYGERDMYYTKGKHEPIISRELWNKCNEIYKKRGMKLAPDGHSHTQKFSKRYLFSSKIQCGCCGVNYSRRTPKNNRCSTFWRCYTAINFKDECSTKAVNETYLKEMFVDLYNDLIQNTSEEHFDLLTRIKEVYKRDIDVKKLNTLKKEEESILKKISNLMDLALEGTLDTKVYASKEKELNGQLKTVQNEIAQFNELQKDNNKIDEKLKTIKDVLDKKEPLTEFDEAIFEKLIDKIIVGEKGEDGTFNQNAVRFILNTDKEYKFLIDDYKNHGASFRTRNIFSNASNKWNI